MREITDIVLDFDGTCTQFGSIYEGFLNDYRESLSNHFHDRMGCVSQEEWSEAQRLVCANSPEQGWSIGNTPSAPVAADPYILADEAARLIARRRGLPLTITNTFHTELSQKWRAPWRPEIRDVLCELYRKGIATHLISNSTSGIINTRLNELLADEPAVRESISVKGGAEKYAIRELTWGSAESIAPTLKQKFEKLPAIDLIGVQPFARPIYLRRGLYFEAICRAIRYDVLAFDRTMVCGDIWELDLAMPFHLGTQVHLIRRESPFDTCAYEISKVLACGSKGGFSNDLRGVIERVL